MLRRTMLGASLGVAIILLACRGSGPGRAPAQTVPSTTPASRPAAARQVASAVNDPAAQRRGVVHTPIVIPGGLLTVIDKEDVPSQREGVLDFIGTEIQPGESVPESQKIAYQVGTETKFYRRLRVGEHVKEGQLLGQLDNRLARDEWAIKQAKVTASDADLVASQQTYKEAQERYNTQLKLKTSTSEEERRGARLAVDRYFSEAISKREGVELSKRELNQAQTQLHMHEIRSKIDGVLKVILRQKGEAVKGLEPVFQVYNLDRLRIEATVEVQHLPDLQLGTKVVVEPTYRRAPAQVFAGHLQEITGVAVSKDKDRPLIVSSSEDGTVRVWDRTSRVERLIFKHLTAVKAVACTPPGAEANLCLSGDKAGKARLWDLNGTSNQQAVELKHPHRGAITSVAFSCDGKLCATGGEDKDIHVYDTATGERRYRIAYPLHAPAVTWLHFTPAGQLVSTGGTTTRLWTLDREAPQGETVVDRRVGVQGVPQLGVSPDGKRVMSDHGNEIRLMSIPEGRIEGTLQPPSASEGKFNKMALFSPDGQLALTAGLSDGRLQLWRLPSETRRGYELQQLVPAPDRSLCTCGAFAPQGGFLVTGNKDRKLFVWTMPTKEETEEIITAEVVHIERSVESADRQVRVWAELNNPQGRLLPGDSVTMVVYPK